MIVQGGLFRTPLSKSETNPRRLSGVPRRCCRDCSGISVILLAAGMVLEGLR